MRSAVAFGIVALMCASGAAGAATLLEDTFDGPGGPLDGRPLSGGGGTWAVADANVNGRGTVTTDGSAAAFAAANEKAASVAFTPAADVYTLSADLNVTSTGDNWVALVFYGASDNVFNDGGGEIWALVKPSGRIEIYGNGFGDLGFGGTPTGAGTGTLSLAYDTRGPVHTLDASFAGTPLDLNAGAAGSTYAFASNPSVGRVGLYAQNDVTAAVDNFRLADASPVPEPSAAVGLAAMGGAAALRRRARPR